MLRKALLTKGRKIRSSGHRKYHPFLSGRIPALGYRPTEEGPGRASSQRLCIPGGGWFLFPEAKQNPGLKIHPYFPLFFPNPKGLGLGLG